MRVRYPARSTTTAAARIRRFRRASRKRRLPAAGAGADGRTLDIRHEATTVHGSGQVQARLELPGLLPNPRRGPPGGAGPPGDAGVLIRGRPRPPGATRRPRAARSPAHSGAGSIAARSPRTVHRQAGGRQNRGIEILSSCQALEQRGRGCRWGSGGRARPRPSRPGHRPRRRVVSLARSAPSSARNPGSAPRATARLSSSTPRRSHSPAAHPA